MKNFTLIGASGYIAPRHLKVIQETNNNLLVALDFFDCGSVMDSYFPNAEFYVNKDVIGLVEKPNIPKSNYAVSGLYFHTNSVVEITKNIQSFKRGELEITSVNQKSLEDKELKLEVLSNGFTCLDANVHEATEFDRAIEKSTRLKIACLEEIAIYYNWISKTKVVENNKRLKSGYYKYIENNLN